MPSLRVSGRPPARELGGPVRFVVGRAGGQFVEFVLWVFVANLAPIREVGILALALLGARYAGFVADWGAQFSGARDTARYGPASAEISAILHTRRLATLVAGGVYAVTLLAVGRPDLLPLTLQIGFRGLNRDWMALGSGRFVASTQPNLVQAIVALGLVVAANDPFWVPTAYGIGAAAGLALSAWSNPQTGADRGPRPAMGGWYVISGLAGLVYTTADSFILGAFAGADDVAIYSSLYRLPNAWLLLLGLAVSGFVPLAHARLTEPGADLRRLTRSLARAGFAGAAIVLGSIPPALWLLPALFGSEYGRGREALAVLMVATAVVTLAAPLQALVIAGGSDRSTAITLASSAGFNVLANLAAVPLLGMTGAALTTLLSQSIPAAFYWHSSRRLTAS